jgi:addiction module RelE/StbE family toxin
MKRTLVWDKSFTRAFKRRTRKNSDLKEKIYSVIEQLVENPFHRGLAAHKLHGELDGLWSCSVEYDCRIIFAIVEEKEQGIEYIVLVDIGTHDEVY